MRPEARAALLALLDELDAGCCDDCADARTLLVWLVKLHGRTRGKNDGRSKDDEDPRCERRQSIALCTTE